MIGKLSGIIDSFGSDHLILDVSGVGYLVYASARTLTRIGQVGDAVSLFIITQVREDSITLFGFADATEQEWFKLLTGVQGVGAKAGLSILAACPVDGLAYVIASQDKTALTRANGVGPKLATRILTELKDKAGKIELGGSEISSSSIPVSGLAPQGSAGGSIEQDAISALTNLGYGSSDAMRAIAIVRQEAGEESADLQTLIRLALKELSS
ncbi:MAG: Holliday junction branch migration protein RuvA [Alphaproteobacteria bacterium]|nr:Holliday junction branch migration protein RuvA [Alphaproteobacteria bacterium]